MASLIEPEPDSASKTLYAALPPSLATLNVAAVPSVVVEPSSLMKWFGPVAGGLPSFAINLPFKVKSDPSKVKFDSPFKVAAVPDPVMILLSALLFIVTPDIPVKLEPSPVNEVAATVPVTVTPVLLV